jgi:protein-S-isoprenylcysteine O-methyltransferase Ste14
MNKSMTLFGCGPKMALLCLPYVILSLAVMFSYPEFLNLPFLDSLPVRIIGFVWIALGLFFWGHSAVFFLRNFKPGVLLTTGPFNWCRNPIYSSIIVFIIPALGIIFHSGLIISIAVMMYIAFTLTIHGEEIILKNIFGEQFEKYRANVNQIFPLKRMT